MRNSNAPIMVASMWTATGVALSFIYLRLALKWRYRKRIGWDDWLVAFSWALLVVYTALTHIATIYGLGHHFLDIPPADLPLAVKYLTIGEFFAVLSLQTSKTSFAVTLLCLASKPWHHWILWCILVSLNIVMTFDAIQIFVSCTPTAKIWRPLLEGNCWDPKTVVDISLVAGAYSGFMDLLLSACPVALLWELRINRREKAGICATMSLGVFAGITAFIKTWYLPDVGRWEDLTYSCYVLLIWTAAEATITIVATSVPYLRLAFNDLRNKGRGSSTEAELVVHVEDLVPNSNIVYFGSTVEDRTVLTVPVPADTRQLTITGGTRVSQQGSGWRNYSIKLNPQ
ncbi:hypothetical protein K504DRAFT_151021 [Pleomassaria siparia CBS 279.74]|uniref:Rhodopsin domain-containing protein n=1 Tax=Pleomassaria siparia CBS 279.74 TaxID=1314801 RepID=A0A6G1KMP9_9PLEO|nr:hypothetical protein K504DRAFT_151021 [Pleomassaria siparia CBS 279.74]